MVQLKSLEDTIVAISTATGQGGIGIVRLSGGQAIDIADQIFESKNGKKPSQFKNFTAHYGHVISGLEKEIIDEALLTVMRAPNSYTKEDVVEISCHGSNASLRLILKCANGQGARLAQPGEFTKRAFLNGRIDLTQAEAVLDIIQAKTDAFLKLSNHQLKGDLSTELAEIRAQLMDIYIEIEAVVNFPEDDVPDDSGFEPLLKKIQNAKTRINTLIDTGEQGKVLKEGIKIALCGKANVGKSSLLNALLKTPRAIVSSIAGTTRDTIEETAQIGGIPFQIIDTAGILKPRDLIEKEAVKRSHMMIAEADLVLFVFDSADDLTQEDENLMRAVNGQNVVAILNKSDLKQKISENRIQDKYKDSRVLKVSALKRTGLKELEAAIVENVWHNQRIDTDGILVSNARHIEALKESGEFLRQAHNAIKDNVSLEFVSEEIKAAISALDHITGREIDTDLLENIFSQFCIGK